MSDIGPSDLGYLSVLYLPAPAWYMAMSRPQQIIGSQYHDASVTGLVHRIEYTLNIQIDYTMHLPAVIAILQEQLWRIWKTISHIVKCLG